MIIVTILCVAFQLLYLPFSEASAENNQTNESLEPSSIEVHFIDVGQADAALVLCDGESLLIDGGNTNDSSLIYSYLRDNGIGHLNYIVCTHAHEDHVGGLAGALNYATVGTVYCSVTEDDTRAFKNFLKYLENQGVRITIPSAGDTFPLGSAQVIVFGPIQYNAVHNNISLVLRITFGEVSFLFTGDAEREEEQDILSAGIPLHRTILKVGHHGSANSTTYPFLRKVMPQYAVISVSENNLYGFPSEDTLSRLQDANVTLYRTDMQGSIICTSDGRSVFSVQRNADANTFELISNKSIESTPTNTIPPGTTYILNTNTRRSHNPSCQSVASMSEKNNSCFQGTYDEAVSLGYTPCGNCTPSK